ncbi:MAG: ABC transporter ATP-binding protein [Myxococcales bacterium]|nr:ABC transporter ATP-binding protein [Myxococcales bacterium]
MAEVSVAISNLEFRYGEGDFALRIPELQVARGEALAFVGPSGSGKTTLLHLIAGIVAPVEGRIVTEGVEVSALSEPARRDFRVGAIGMVFQEFELLEYLSVFDNIVLPYRINSTLRLNGRVRARAHELADRLGIAKLLGRRPAQLSQGERQRVAVCRALVVDPPLLLADEPTGNLDPANKLRVLDLLFDVARERGATLVTVTHDHELLPHFDRVLDFKQFTTSDSP